MDCWQASIRQTEPQRGLGRHQGLLAARVLLDLVVECAMRIVRLLLTDLFRRAIFVAGWSDSVGTGDYMAIRVATSRIHVAFRRQVVGDPQGLQHHQHREQHASRGSTRRREVRQPQLLGRMQHA